jgi:hypothetical protein
MSSFRIDIKTDTDAFRSHDDTLGIEIARILRSLAARIKSEGSNLETFAVFEFPIRDINGNPMPGGSTVTGTLSGSGLTLSEPSTFTLGCSAQSPSSGRRSGRYESWRCGIGHQIWGRGFSTSISQT